MSLILPQQAQELIGGKFNTQEDLLKAYQELEKAEPGSADSDASAQPQTYTAEQALDVYGEEIVNAVGEAGLNMADLMWQADNGGDISQHYDALAQAIGVPKQSSRTMSPRLRRLRHLRAGVVDEASIINEVGGQDAFNRLSDWARSNLSQQELADYNAVVDGGNSQAIRWALKAMQSRICWSCNR